MTSTRKFPVVLLVLMAASVSMGPASRLCAQGSRGFATAGVTELGGSISFESITPVARGETGTATTVLTFAPFVGYFVTDGFELGLNPFSITSMSSGGHSATQFLVIVAPSYNFRTEGKVFPFIEAQVGYASVSGEGSSRSGLAWGGRAGVKAAVVAQGLLTFGVQYLLVTENPPDAPSRYGTNQLSIGVGFTIWL